MDSVQARRKQGLYIDGTAACGKTSAVKQLDGVLNDFSELCQEFPWAKRRHQDEFINSLCQLHENLKSNTCSFAVDRSPFAAPIYKAYFSDCEVDFTDPESLEKWFPTESPIRVLIVIDTDVDAVVARMISRNNGLDDISERYVRYQNKAFANIAKKYDFEMIDLGASGKSCFFELDAYIQEYSKHIARVSELYDRMSIPVFSKSVSPIYEA